MQNFDVYKRFNIDNMMLQISEFSTYTLETQMLDKQKMLSLLEGRLLLNSWLPSFGVQIL